MGSKGGHWMARGSMNNCWGLLEQWSLQFKIIVNRARNASGIFNKSNKIKRADQISATVVWKHIRFEQFFIKSSIVMTLWKLFCLFRHKQYCSACVAVESTQIYFDTYFPCISNCWVRPRGLQKIVYFTWGSACRKVWEPLF